VMRLSVANAAATRKCTKKTFIVTTDEFMAV